MPVIGRSRFLWLVIGLLVGSLLLAFYGFRAISAGGVVARTASPHASPSRDGWFQLRPVGSWRSLPGDRRCTSRVHRSTWEPRSLNAWPNHHTPRPAAVHASFRSRPVAVDGSYDPRWDSWLLQRVSGHHTGTTDENIQWAACKWGLPDNLLRAIAVRESTWFQAATYASGRCVPNYGCGDLRTTQPPGSATFCAAISRYGHDYQAEHAPATGLCPRTFGIVGVMSWQDPSWGRMPDNQNGTFPFNRDSTAFALDYLGSQLRGCYEGWERWLGNTGARRYSPGDLWGCVGAWYAGEWHSPAAGGYIARVRRELADRTWLTRAFARQRPPCSPQLGCARADH